MTRIPPQLAYSALSGRVYFVSSWVSEGVARNKVDVTDSFYGIVRQIYGQIHEPWCHWYTKGSSEVTCTCKGAPNAQTNNPRQ